jgi:hypothetical protein
MDKFTFTFRAHVFPQEFILKKINECFWRLNKRKATNLTPNYAHTNIKSGNKRSSNIIQAAVEHRINQELEHQYAEYLL